MSDSSDGSDVSVTLAASGGGADAPPVPPPASQPQPIAVSWRVLSPLAPWLPPELTHAFPWAATHAYADTDTFESRLDETRHVLAISQRGRVHAHEGTHREDAFGCAHGPGGYAMVVADGAGSAPLSRVGAEFMCREVLSRLSALVESDGLASPEGVADLLARSVREASDALQASARSAGREIRDFRATVLACIAHGDAVALLQVGDGAMIVARQDGTISRIGEGDTGSYSGEVSVFAPELEGIDLRERVSLLAAGELESLMLMSDGIEDPFYPVERRARELLGQLYTGVSSPADGFRRQAVHGPIVGSPNALELLKIWIDFERRGENDDRTLAAAFRLPPRSPV